MSEYYHGQRTRNLYDPASPEPFKLSRSKIEAFLKCPRCFYLDRRLGVAQPAGFPFNLNSAVDNLLKKEFDGHRVQKTAHPLMQQYGIDAVPYAHADLEIWRENFKGVSFYHQPTNLVLCGALDDVWQNPAGELHVVDYKATSKEGEVSLDAEWQRSYKNQVEIYQWLLRRNNFKVSPVAYFVYVNGRRDRAAFDARLEFDVKIIPYQGDDAWVEPVIIKLAECLKSPALPLAGPDCDYCRYRQLARAVEIADEP